MANYYEYLHLDSSENTVAGFVNNPTSIAKLFQGKVSELLNFSDENGITNSMRILNMYTKKDDLTKYTSPTSINEGSPLYTGTLLHIPKDQAFNENQAVTGKDLFLTQKNIKTYLNEQLKNLLADPTYLKANVIETEGSNFSVKLMNENVQVWLWIRALNKIVNISKFIRNLGTSVTNSGGNFSLDLAPIDDLSNVSFISEGQAISNIQIVSNSKLTEPYFSKYIQKNDIVFIRFEKLDNEVDREKNYNELFIEINQLPNQIYDMIGLVDENSLTYNASNEPVISVIGRDFTKLLVEDGSYFLPFVLLENSGDFFVNTQKDNKLFKRIFVSGKYTGLFFYTFRTISDSLGFIFNQLTNTGILPDNVDLFKNYDKEKLSKTYQLSDGNKDYLEEVDQNGVWKIIKLEVDEKLDERRLANSDISRPDGTLLEQVYKVCQDPFVEFWGDTFGDTYTFIARQPPFTKNQIVDWLDNYQIIKVNTSDVDSFNLSWETEYYSWYQVQPQNSFLGNSNFIYAAYIPIVWLPQYVDMFGNHKKVVVCNYISYNAIKGSNGKQDINLFRQAVAEDLSFVIESTCYLPFTRKGKIVIKGGDRRIKRGTYIEFEPTGEVYYVDAVENGLSVNVNTIDRTTILSVSRGMVKEFIKGRSIDGVEMSYFNIVNTENIKDQIISKVNNSQIVTKNTRSNIVVDQKVFDFFVQRRQTEGELAQYSRLSYL